MALEAVGTSPNHNFANVAAVHAGTIPKHHGVGASDAGGAGLAIIANGTAVAADGAGAFAGVANFVELVCAGERFAALPAICNDDAEQERAVTVSGVVLRVYTFAVEDTGGGMRRRGQQPTRTDGGLTIAGVVFDQASAVTALLAAVVMEKLCVCVGGDSATMGTWDGTKTSGR